MATKRIIHVSGAADANGSRLQLFEESETSSGGTIPRTLRKLWDSLTLDAKLAAKQDKLTFDNAPMANSDNPVKSGGIKTALDGKQDALSAAQLANIAAVPGKADTAGLNYAIAEAGYATTGAKLPEGVTVWYNGTKISDFTIMHHENVDDPTIQPVWELISGVEFCGWSEDGRYLGGVDALVFKIGETTLDPAPNLLVPRALADRVVNLLDYTVSGATVPAEIALQPPSPVQKHSVDFYLTVILPKDATAPSVNVIMDEDHDYILDTPIPALRTSTTSAAKTVIHFTEVSFGHFIAVDAGAPVVQPSALRYDLGTPIVIDTATSEEVEGETVNYGAAALADRTANRVSITAAIAELRLTFSAAVSGKVRDFGLRVEVGDGTAALTAPALVPPAGVTLENADGAIPALADGAATAKGVTLLYFSETAPGVFVVKGEQVEEVA